MEYNTDEQPLLIEFNKIIEPYQFVEEDALFARCAFLRLSEDKEHAKTLSHSMDVARNLAKIARHYGQKDASVLGDFDAGQAFLLGLAHDLGKLGVSVEDLYEQDPKNFDIEPIKPHSGLSYKMIKELASTEKQELLADRAIRHHTFQGERSYPDRLPQSEESFEPGTQPYTQARLLALADFYGALSRDNGWKDSNDMEDDTDKDILLKCNPDVEDIIEELYNAGVFQ